jgi:hypothetical protein
MTYRTKLMTLLVGMVVLVNGLLALVDYRRCENLLEKEFHRKARSIVSTAAALLDPKLVGAIRNTGDENKPEYTALKTQLQKIRELNRRKDVWIADLFTLMPASRNPKYVEYGVDAEDNFAYQHRVGRTNRHRVRGLRRQLSTRSGICRVVGRAARPHTSPCLVLLAGFAIATNIGSSRCSRDGQAS